MPLTAEAELIEITGEPGAYAEGRTFRCSVCGTRVRPGQSHRTSVTPAHATLAALIVEERLVDEDSGGAWALNL